MAALVAGSRLGKRRLQAVLQADPHRRPRPGGSEAEPGPAGGHARGARGLRARGLHPEDPAPGRLRGYRDRLPRVRHRLGQRGLPHRLRPELQQLGPRPQQLLRRARQGRRLGAHGAAPTARSPRPCPPPRLWNEIAYAAWACADPGVQYDTTINEWHTCPEDGRINASNPCSEYMFLDDTACNLASINLSSSCDRTASFDVEGFRHACRLWTMVLEISVLMAAYPSRSIAQKSCDFRTLGLGYANMGTVLMRSGIPYDSAGGRRHLRRHHRHHARRGLCHLGRDGQGARPLPRLRQEPRCTCCASSAITAAPPTTPPPANTRASASRPRASIRRTARQRLLAGGARDVGPGARARREARLPQRAGHRASRPPAPSASSWTATPPASSPTSPSSSSRSWRAAATSRSSTRACRLALDRPGLPAAADRRDRDLLRRAQDARGRAVHQPRHPAS